LENAIIVKDLVKKHKNEILLDQINLSIKKGEVLGIVGKNGAGKSILLKIICGLVFPTSGEIIINGLSILREPYNIMNNVGFLIEEPALYEYLTGKKQLEICLMLHDLDKKTNINFIIEKLSISEFLNKNIKEYSLGMKQRLGIACAVVHNPSILILDEPTNSLDIEGIKRVEEFLREMKDKGKTIIMSGHLLTKIEEICDRVIILEKGKIIDSFPVKEINKLARISYSIKIKREDDIISFLELNSIGEIKDINEEYVAIIVGEKHYSSTLKMLIEAGYEITDSQKIGSSLEHYFGKGGNNS